MLLRYGWAFPVTLLGTALAALALRHGSVRLVDGVLEAHGPWLQRVLSSCPPLKGGVAAITLGHIVLGQDEATLALTRAHERVHVRQYERWGVFFLPAYLVASLAATVCGGHYYFDNVFERAAYNASAHRCGSAAYTGPSRGTRHGASDRTLGE